MITKKYLIVNADDFGLSPGVNRGIAKAHENGIVSSASLMVRWPDATEAAIYGRNHPSLSLGLHIDLGEWAYDDGLWEPVYEVVSFDDIPAIEAEMLRQLDIFRQLTGKNPTHIDSHQHVHLREPTCSILEKVIRELAVPLRHFSSDICYCGDFYGQTTEGSPLPSAIQVESLMDTLTSLPVGITELACHPGEIDDLKTTYKLERAQELMVLCDPRIEQAAMDAKIELVSFGNIP